MNSHEIALFEQLEESHDRLDKAIVALDRLVDNIYRYKDQTDTSGDAKYSSETLLHHMQEEVKDISSTMKRQVRK